MPKFNLRALLSLRPKADTLFPIWIIGILGVLVIPVPPFLMDLFLAFNLSFSLIILVNALYVNKPLQMSVFPSLMLVVTLFRLGLNVASTRLILGQAYAGEMITAFGSYVVKDNYVVGVVIFVILVVIQYVVIVKGTERNAEVGARFTLDAMPGKQMSIDADLNAGLINENEALHRREELMREANFYGAMDGASKFVRGDAIAGIIITLVNIVAGFVVGVLQMDMSASDSLATYMRLTIGDGLVSQIPALIVSTSAGMVVSRAAADDGIGREAERQLFGNRTALYLVAGALTLLGLVPGIPAMPLLLLAGALVGITKLRGSDAEEGAEDPMTTEQPAVDEDSAEQHLKLDRIEVAVGYGLVPLMEKGGGSDFLDRVVSMRRQLAQELGMVVPRIRVRDDIRLQPNEYSVRLKGHRIAGGHIAVGQYLAMGDASKLAQLHGEDTKEPAFGIDAKWIGASEKIKAEDLGLTAVNASVVLATHLTETIKSNAWEILSRQDVQELLDQLQKNSPAIIKDVVPDVVSLGTVHRVLQNLLRERVSIRDLGNILEVLSDFAPQVKEVDLLSEYVRTTLGREILSAFVGADGKLEAIAVDPVLEQRLARALQDAAASQEDFINPQETQALLIQLGRVTKAVLDRGVRPAIVCAPRARLVLRRLIEGAFPTLPVLSYPEINKEVEVLVAGVLKLGGETRLTAHEAPAREEQPVAT